MKQKNVILMVVAVGFGLVAALLTSQMSGRTPTVEQIPVIVAAKDLPVGTMMTKNDLKDLITIKNMPKDGLPQAYVLTEEELLDKRLARGIRKGETFNPADLSKGGVITLPPGMSMVSLPIAAAQSVAGFVGPGSRVDVLATVRLQNQVKAFPLMVNMLVLAVDTATSYTANGVFPSLSTVSFAVTRKQALLFELAKARGCTISLMLKNPDEKNIEEKDDIDKKIKELQDNSFAVVAKDEGGDDGQDPANRAAQTKPKNAKPDSPETVQVPVANEEIAAGTEITNDLIDEKFSLMDLPKSLADEAITDLKSLTGKYIKTGLSKNHWVTKSIVGDQPMKPAPLDQFIPEKGGSPAEPPKTTQAAPVSKRKTYDLKLHGSSGTKVFRYEEIQPGEWRLVGEVDLLGSGRGSEDAKKSENSPLPPPKPENKKVD